MRIHPFGIVLVALVAVLGLASVATAVNCTSGGFQCTATSNVVTYTGVPTVPCPNWVPVVRITTTATCLGGGTAGPVVELRCGIDNTGFTFSGGGYQHSIGLRKGNWQDVLNGNCHYISYKVK